MEYISPKLIETIKMIVDKYPETIFCGSLGLVLNGVLEREVHDIDIITLEDYYNTDRFFPKIRDKQKPDDTHSEKFMVGPNEVKCFRLNFPNGTNVDVLYNKNLSPLYAKMDVLGMNLNIEIPRSAISAKKGYIQRNSNIYAVTKHLKDLIMIGIAKDKLIELIDDSCLIEGWTGMEFLHVDPPKTIDLPKEGLAEDDLPF